MKLFKLIFCHILDFPRYFREQRPVSATCSVKGIQVVKKMKTILNKYPSPIHNMQLTYFSIITSETQIASGHVF